MPEPIITNDDLAKYAKIIGATISELTSHQVDALRILSPIFERRLAWQKERASKAAIARSESLTEERRREIASMGGTASGTKKKGYVKIKSFTGINDLAKKVYESVIASEQAKRDGKEQVDNLSGRGGKARAEALTKEQRQEIARKGVEARAAKTTPEQRREIARKASQAAAEARKEKAKLKRKVKKSD